MKYEQLTHKIIGCAMEVHSALGNGFQEVIYQRALEYELELQNIHYAREVGNAGLLQRFAGWNPKSGLFN